MQKSYEEYLETLDSLTPLEKFEVEVEEYLEKITNGLVYVRCIFEDGTYSVNINIIDGIKSLIHGKTLDDLRLEIIDGVRKSIIC
jgi:hypothetical protein